MHKEQQLQFISIERIPERPREPVRQNAGGRQRVAAGRSIPARQRAAGRRRKGVCGSLIALTCIILLLAVLGISHAPKLLKGYLGSRAREKQIEKQEELLAAGGDVYPQELSKMLDLNQETLHFVEGYGERARWQGEEIDLSGEVTAGQVPLLMQWDRRWGYDVYGDGMIGWAGCGPVCMTMAYLYLTDDASMNPRRMAEFADRGGYHADGGTSWDFWTAGAEELGLRGEELPLSEGAMQSVLENGGLVVCSMGPGDFTTTGHYILIRGYDEKGFYVNDPNRKSNSEKQWSYDTLAGQIKNLWGIYR